MHRSHIAIARRVSFLRLVCRVALVLPLFATVGCGGRAEPEGEVVLFTTVDQEFAAPILSAFTRATETTITPRAEFAAERLAEGIIGESDARPSSAPCDVIWDDTLLATLRLQQQGLLASRSWEVPADSPALAEDGTWCGIAARARVLIINENLLPEPENRPTSVLDLADPQWQGQCGIANPLTGTTATHASVLYEELGRDRFVDFFTSVSKSAEVLPTDRQVAHAVALGRLAWGVTDSDAAITERDDQMPVVIVFPDQQPAQFGTLRIPNTIAVLKDAPHPNAASTLADFLVSPETEERLAMGDSAQIPLFRAADFQPRILPAEGARWMEVDYQAVAEAWEATAEILTPLFSHP